MLQIISPRNLTWSELSQPLGGRGERRLVHDEAVVDDRRGRELSVLLEMHPRVLRQVGVGVAVLAADDDLAAGSGQPGRVFRISIAWILSKNS